MPELSAGQSFIEVLPSLGRFFQRVKGSVTGKAVDVDVTPKVSQADMDKARKQVEAASDKVAKARSKEADAAGAVRAAEARLETLRDSGRAKADQLVAAEERVAKARRASEAAQRSLSQAEGAQRSAERRVERIKTEIEVDDSKAQGEVSGFAARAKASLGALRGKVEVDTDTGEQRVIGMGQRIRNSLGAAGGTAGAAAGTGIMSGLAGKVAAIGLAGVGIGGALVAGITQAMNVEDARAKLTAQLGLSAEESRAYGAIAGRLYSGAYGENLDQVNDAIRGVIQNIGAMDDPSLERVSGKVLNLAQVFGIDLQGATAAVGTMLRSGLAPDADAALDVITTGFQMGADKAGDFLDTLTEYSVQFQKLGLDGAAATGLISQGLDAGARSSDLVADALKEFSIRAVDGSKLTAEGFSAVGLNAQDMAAKIAKGGPEAAGALDLTLDRLRAMPDPVKRSQAAVALFGTQAEDLGQSLYALDPSAAVQSMSNVGGAAQRMGDTLSETSSARIERFKRSLQTGVVDFIGGAVLPVFDTLGKVGEGIFGSAWGPITDFLGFLAGTGGTIVAVIGGIALATWAWTAASGALSGTLLANPITWVIAGIIALVAAVIYAYNHFEWFQKAVSAVGDFFVWLWQSILKPVVDFLVGAFSAAIKWIGDNWTWLSTVLGILIGPIGWVILAFTTFRDTTMAVLSAVGGFFVWLWQGVLWPILSAIGTALAYLGLAIFTLLVTPFYLAWQGIAAVAGWLWDSILSPFFDWLGGILAAVGQWFVGLWQTYVVPAWNGIVAAVQFAWGIVSGIFSAIIAFIGGVLAAAWRFLWTNVVQPVWNGIVAAIQVAWGVIQYIWAALMAYIFGPLGSVFNWLWHNLIEPVWNGIVAAIRGAWDFIKSIFDVGMRAVDAVGRAFQSVADWIARAWDSIKNAARAPIQFVVDVVYNNGIRKVWNGIAGLFGMAQLPEVHFAEGGVLPGYAPGRDTVPALLSRGEGVLVPEAVRALGPGFVGWANRTFSGGRSDGGAGTGGGRGYSRGGIARYADGGIVDKIGGFFSNVFGDPIGAVRGLFSGVLGDGANTPGAGGWTDALKKVPGKVVDGVVAKVKKWVADLAAMGGSGAGGNWAPVASQALAITRHPQSSLWRVLKQIQIESGGNPRAINLWDSNAKKGTPSKGLIQTIDPTFQRWRLPGLPNDPYHPLSNIVAGIRYADARYGGIERIWPKTLGYDAGGVLPQGLSMAVNNTSGSERMAVFTDAQWSALSGLVGELRALPATLRELVAGVGSRLGSLQSGMTSVTGTVTSRLADTGAQFRTAAGSIDTSAGAIDTAAVAIGAAADRIKSAAAAPAAAQRMVRAEDGSMVPASYYAKPKAAAPAQRMVRAEDGSYVPASYYRKFDRGGMARGTGVLAKDVISPERVLSPGQTRDFSALSQALSAGRLVQVPPGADGLGDLRAPAPAMSRGQLGALEDAGRGAPFVGELHVHGGQHDPDQIADIAVRKLEFLMRNN